MFRCRITWGMETALTSQDSPAEIAALFAYLDAPAEKVAPVAPAAAVAKAAKTIKPIHYAEIKGKDRTLHGRLHEGQVIKGFQAEVIPGQSVRLFGTQHNRVAPLDFDITFAVGDIAVRDSYNLVYTGIISAIGPKTVTILDHDRTYKLDLYTFANRNWNYDAERIHKRNSEWCD